MIENDPVCGSEVEFDADTKKNVPRQNYGEQTYFFCSESCKEEFDLAPEEYV